MSHEESMQDKPDEETMSMSGEHSMPMQGEPHEESMPMSGQSHEETMSMQDKPHEQLNETDSAGSRPGASPAGGKDS